MTKWCYFYLRVYNTIRQMENNMDYIFTYVFKDSSGAAITASDTPTISVIDYKTGLLIVDSLSVTKQSLFPSICSYKYSGFPGMILLGIMQTGDVLAVNKDSEVIVPIISYDDPLKVSSGTISIQSGYTFRKDIYSASTDDLSIAEEIKIAIKHDAKTLDEDSLIYMNASAGLITVLGELYVDSSMGSIIVTGSVGNWVISLYVDQTVSSLLVNGDYLVGVKALIGTDENAVWNGRAYISNGAVLTIG